jgi:hypothetical protein
LANVVRADSLELDSKECHRPIVKVKGAWIPGPHERGHIVRIVWGTVDGHRRRVVRSRHGRVSAYSRGGAL